ncbi:MAG: hypothetical protein A2Z97_09745 [Bdellovibrionales bacterium GWB1_52_6]|nr:MAG: hypothetical protein A2Z97_09745 [Bdellovibrionales bacterium GWB1_52_6]OFZ06214.1 MAG: hypothetical protein A2X97_09175 [Bdellovibrionales bacterium GWA1_52_35]
MVPIDSWVNTAEISEAELVISGGDSRIISSVTQGTSLLTHRQDWGMFLDFRENSFKFMKTL